jgi:o-succinylbenzoate synthase
VKTWVDFDRAPVFALPLTDEVDGRDRVEGILVEGPQGWGEFAAPPDLDDRRAARWLTAAVEAGTVGWPDPVRGRVPVAVVVPAVAPERAGAVVAASGCRTAAVTVARPGTLPADDIARLAAVREALGPAGEIYCDADGHWDVETAVAVIPQLDRAAGGLRFVEQPCATLGEIAVVRRALDIPVAVDQCLRDAEAPTAVDLREAADIAVLTVAALGGVRRALRVAETCGLPCVVAATPESSVGLAGGVALAGVLPDAGLAHALGIADLLAADVVSPGRRLLPVDGHLPVAPMPAGPDPAGLERHRVTDPETVQWWRARVAAVQRLL